MRVFIIIWVGQILSLLGTAVGQFGLTLWAFDASGGQATPLALVGFFFMAPMVAFAPIVGVLVDRANRKLMMMLSDLAAATATFFILILYLSGNLQIWHLYVTAFITGTFQGFQWPAYSAAISTMLDKKHYTRANAMLETAGSASGILAPVIAGALIGPLGNVIRATFDPAFVARLGSQPGLLGLLAMDLLSASFAIGTLLFVDIPQPKRTAIGEQAHGNFMHEAAFGFQYIFKQPSLLGLQIVFLLGNFFSSFGSAIYAAMILARTGNNAVTFGSVESAAAIGGVVGGLAISAWGGFKRRVHGVLLGWALSGAGMVAAGLSRTLPGWLVAGFCTSMLIPLINGSNQAIWQVKVPPDVQGRVFASRRLIAWLVSPLSQLLAGPLADRVFEPAMQEGGALTPIFSRLAGVGHGAGMGLQFAFAGFFVLVVGLGGYLFPVIRNAEDLLPDHDAVPPVPASAPVAAD
ncbi:MAG TPA: MFS transporter [Anaerolineae bacterium]|nr:MFS transporter [Anaerolineae bacterium]HQH36963.1 MFS transporter [Anaerolineae bacterium]